MDDANNRTNQPQLEGDPIGNEAESHQREQIQIDDLLGNLSRQSVVTNDHSINSFDNHDDNNTIVQKSEESTPTQLQRTNTSASIGPPFSVFTKNQKRFIVFMASWAGFFSPVSSNIYFPSLNALAQDLNVSNSLINLTLTSYMIFQGLAPAFIGSLADSMGRRPAYTICFVIYIAANIGLAVQNSYAALFVLRCLQSTGSSATIAMASAVVADVATTAERGKYMGFTFGGSLLGPAIGPVLGGILAEFLGWRSIFWFLTILSAAFLLVFLVFFPETARGTVGNGSVAPQGWNMSLMNYLAIRKAQREQLNSPNEETEQEKHAVAQPPSSRKFRFPNPLASLTILLDKQNALILFYNGFLFASFYDITAVIPSQFAKNYHFNDLQIGLCYLPFGFGSMAAALVNGQLLDRNFARWCRKLDVPIRRGREQDLRTFPIEKARLQIALPAIYIACVMVVIFGWLLEVNGPLAAMLVSLFVTAFSMSIAFNVVSTLMVDMYPTAPATATAANNLVRCLIGAGATGVVIPMVDAMGRGWTFTFLALFLIATSPMIWVVFFRGAKWREERRVRNERSLLEKEARKARRVEQGQLYHGRRHSWEGRVEQQSSSTPVEGGLVELAAVVEKEREVHAQELRVGQQSVGQRKLGLGLRSPEVAVPAGLYRAKSHDLTV